MKTMQWLVVSAALAVGTSAPASAAQTDPEVIIYRFPGVAAVAAQNIVTAFHCTNFSGVTENVRFVTRNFDASLKSNLTMTLDHLATKTASTRITLSYSSSLILDTGEVTQGTTAIAATSIDIICTAMTIDSSATKPVGVALRGIRFSPVPGSQE